MDKVKNHFKKHKNKYLIGLGAVACVGAGVGVGYYIRPSAPDASAIATQTVTALKVGDVTQNVTQVVTRRGHPGYVIQCNETGEQFASIRRAAEMMGIDRGALRRHLAGELPDVDGLTYTNLGEAA